MKNFEIHIGEIFNIETKKMDPKQKIIISEEQFDIIKRFASTKKDEDLNTIYKLNQCEFKILPHFENI